MTGIDTQCRDRKHREWEKLCAEVARALELFTKIDAHVTWLVSYVRGSLPPDPPQDQQYCPGAG